MHMAYTKIVKKSTILTINANFRRTKTFSIYTGQQPELSVRRQSEYKCKRFADEGYLYSDYLTLLRL